MRFRQLIAEQLKKPSGYLGKVMARLMNMMNERMNNFALSRLAIEPQHKTLEVGFGNGGNFTHLLRMLPEGQLVGLDYSGTMVKLVQENFQAEIRHGRLEVHAYCLTAQK